MRWLLLKDLQILKRSPFLVALLVIYPIVIALLIGFALSKGPDKPKVAFLNLVEVTDNTFTIGGAEIDASKYSSNLFDTVDRVDVATRNEAIEKVEDGEVLGALIIPPDITEKLTGGVEQPEIETIYNAEDPVKARFVENTIKSRLADANQALSRQFTRVAGSYIGLLLKGGEFTIFGRDLEVLGLEKSRQIIDAAVRRLGPDSPQARELARVATFAGLAIDNLDLTDNVLASVGSPLKVRKTELNGSKTPLDDFAVAVSVTLSLMFVTVLLASGMLAMEREENAFTRLVRGLVTRTGLLAEKIGLAAICSFFVALLMTVGIAVFIGLDWDRFPLWLLAIGGGAVGFASLGVAIGGVAREVRAASLLAFLLSLPIAFLALVPSGAVSAGLYDVIRVASALFPFKPTLQALNAAFNDSDPGIATPLLHLAALTVGFGAIARLALRRFG